MLSNALQDAVSVESVRKITEKSEKAMQEFFKKVEQFIKSAKNNLTSGKMEDIAEMAASEYQKIFGRLGMQPLLYLKGGKKAPRYIVDRNEVWVIYKPALWHLGGQDWQWKEAMKNRMEQDGSLPAALKAMEASMTAENLYEWHGLHHGTRWIPRPLEDEVQKVAKLESWGFLQRLDQETDGPIVVAKSWRQQRCIKAQMNAHVFTKAYMCLVHGRVENKIQVVKCRFAELGGRGGTTQIMLKHDFEHDPFIEWTQSNRWKNRSVRMAETFIKPIAYYIREKDGSEYTLMYVNILTGITHQIRISMQAVGHPLVSDDRYLPKEQAMKDVTWCPRNFLTEVRSDWWDMCPPYADEKRRKFTRISLENPLPMLFQTVMEKELKLVEKLDPTADLFGGCQYWAIGDEQLMNAYPKDRTYVRKVMRWGQRRGIHMDAMNRLLLLSKEDIEEVLNSYTAPDDPADTCWVCPRCMSLNVQDEKNQMRRGDRGGSFMQCDGKLSGFGADAKLCGAPRIFDENAELPSGFLNFVSDPTMHLLMKVNGKWLEARRQVLRYTRPTWERPPPESEGTPCTEKILQALEPYLEVNARGGGHGISEEELKNVPGLESITLPLGQPPEESKVSRMRLPASGNYSQWAYSLKGKYKVKASQDYSCKTTKLSEPIQVGTDKLPTKMIITKEEKERRQRKRDREAARLVEVEAEEERQKAQAKEEERRRKEDEQRRKREREEKEEETRRMREQIRQEERRRAEAEVAARDHALNMSSETEGKRRKISAASAWQRLESTKSPGQFYYWNKSTNETRMDKPPDVEEPKSEWERLESKSHPGQFYYFNAATGATRMDRPNGNAENDAKAANKAQGIPWERKESSSKPGSYYYFNPLTNSNQVEPPEVDHPWKLLESKTKKGQYYYFNETTGENSVDPPRSARSKAAPAVGANGRTTSEGDLPANWIRKESSKYAGKFYYENVLTQETRWERPVANQATEGSAKAGTWQRKESSKNPGSYYYVNTVTGETSWEKKA